VRVLGDEPSLFQRRRGLRRGKAPAGLAQAGRGGCFADVDRVAHGGRVRERNLGKTLPDRSRDERELDRAQAFVAADLQRAERDEARPQALLRFALEELVDRPAQPRLLVCQLEVHAVTRGGGRGCGSR
jgi:hypothetical protein